MKVRFLIIVVMLSVVPHLRAQAAPAKPLTEAQARQLATDFANKEVKDKFYTHRDGTKKPYPRITSTEDWYRVVFEEGRWHLYIGGWVGWNVNVSFKSDGSDPKLEKFEFTFSEE